MHHRIASLVVFSVVSSLGLTASLVSGLAHAEEHSAAAETSHTAAAAPHAPEAGAHAAAALTHKKYKDHVLKPAPVYDGSTPIDLSHGMTGGNGTFGLPNSEYEAKRDAEISAPGVFAAPYPFSAKKAFIASIADRLRFFEEAVVNLEERGTMVTEESNKFSDTAGPKIRELLGLARDAHSKLKSAGEKEWVGAEQAAHISFVELKTTYEKMMLPPVEAASTTK